jgi:hypothetical protein
MIASISGKTSSNFDGPAKRLDDFAFGGRVSEILR